MDPMTLPTMPPMATAGSRHIARTGHPGRSRGSEGPFATDSSRARAGDASRSRQARRGEYEQAGAIANSRRPVFR